MSRDYFVADSWSGEFDRMKAYVDTYMITRHQAPPSRKMGRRWKIKVGGIYYSEMWLRYYAQVRHIQRCTVMAADWANRMTNKRLPIVRDLDTDLELLLAHARLQQRAGERTIRKGGVYVAYP